MSKGLQKGCKSVDLQPFSYGQYRLIPNPSGSSRRLAQLQSNDGQPEHSKQNGSRNRNDRSVHATSSRGVRALAEPGACRAQLNETSMPRNGLREAHRSRTEVTVEISVATVVGEGYTSQHTTEHVRDVYSAPRTGQVSADDISGGVHDGKRTAAVRAGSRDVRDRHRQAEIASQTPLASQEIGNSLGNSLTSHATRSQQWVYARAKAAAPIKRRIKTAEVEIEQAGPGWCGDHT